MTFARREYVGAAVATTLASSINSSDTSISLVAATNWPTGSVGNFYIVIDRGLVSEEKILCSARTTTTLTVTTRGTDGTSAAAHSSGAAVEHIFTAKDADEANDHYATTSYDHHTQYMLASGTRHDLTARHTFGAALGTPAAATTSAVGDAAAAGTAATPARSDHTHGREAFATNAITLATAATAGSAATLIRSNAAIAAFDATAPTTSAVGDAAATGSVAFAARRDHTHGREAFAAPVADSPAGNSTGSATTINHSDHVHQSTGTLASGYAQATTTQNSITTAVDLTSLTVTVTTVAGRRYRVTASLLVSMDTTNSTFVGMILADGTQIKQGNFVAPTVGATGTLEFSAVITPSAGSHTYKVQGQGTAGIGASTASATSPAYILVQDIGT